MVRYLVRMEQGGGFQQKEYGDQHRNMVKSMRKQS